MRIGIDLEVLGQKHLTGVPKYALNITRALLAIGSEHEWVLFVPHNAPFTPSYLKRGEGELFFLPPKRLPFFSTHWTYAKIMQKAKLDVLFGPANSVPWFYSGKTVITIHDLAIYKHPEWFPQGQWFSTQVLVPRSIRKASNIIVPSQVTARDLKELFEVPEGKISVIPHGVEERFFPPTVIPAKAGIQSPDRCRGRAWIPDQVRDDKRKGKYILFVGTLEPRKNVKRLIEAYQMLPEEIREKYDLVIAGDRAWLDLPQPLLMRRGERGGRGAVRFLGYVPDEDLPALYQGAKVFVYPSLYEGFGLPVLEAMAAGVPVVTSRETAMSEICSLPIHRPINGRATSPCVLINPHSISEISQAILTLIRDNAYLSQISKAGQELARNYAWERAALSTLLVLTGY